MLNKKPDAQHTKAYVSNRAIEVLVKIHQSEQFAKKMLLSEQMQGK